MAEKKEKIDYKYNLKKYLAFLSKHKIIFLAAALFILIAEIIRVSTTYLFKIITDKGSEFASNTLAKEVYLNTLFFIAIAYISFVIIKTLSKWLSLHFINQLETKMIFDLKQFYFNHLIKLSHSFHTTHRTGSLIARLGRGASAIERMDDFLAFNILPVFFQIVIIGGSLIYLEWTSAVIVYATAIIFITYSLIMQRTSQKANAEMNKSEDREKAYVADVFTNIDSIKYFGKENTIKNKFAAFANATRSRLLTFWNFFRWMDSGQSLIISSGVFVLMVFTLKNFIQGKISLGTMVFIYGVFGSVMDQMFGLMHGIRNYYRSMADFEDLFQYGKIEQEVKDKESAKDLNIAKGEITFQDVSFSYGKRKVISDFNLRIKPGEKVALVGHSGSGKTTLIKLLYRLYDLKEGHILIDGESIRDFKQESLRSELSIVPQECILFDDTVYNNILFSKPNATKTEVFRAIKLSQLDKVIANFPYKEKTIVGERGVKLSGGEKQRVSIARAILADKKVIVLDEATSALDSQTESEIQKDLQGLLENRTSIIIAHRLSTIMRADRIIVLEKGKIVQIGKHSQLINQPGQYKKLWNLQRGGYLQE